MSALTVSCFDTLFIAIELTMMAVIISSFSKRRLSLWIAAASLPALAVIIHVLSTLCSGNQIIRACANVVLMTAWSRLCFRVSFTKCIFVVMFCVAYYNVADMTFIIIYTELVGIDVSGFIADMYNYVSFNILVKLAELLGAIALYVWIRRHSNAVYAGAGSWIRTLIYPLASMIVGICLVKVVTDFPGTGVDVFICMLIVLFTDLMYIFLANYLERQQAEVHKSAILRASVKSELENVRAWQDAYVQQRKMTHEFNNQLAVIKGMVEQGGKAQEILDYIGQIQKLPYSSKRLVNTRRAVADVVINQKLSIASSKNIDFRVQLDDLSPVKLPDDALVVVLANVIDNAIEAADKVADEQKRKISLKIKASDDVTFLSIENYTESPVVIKNNRVVTSKGDRVEHGYGLLNVSSIVAQYGGFYTLSYDEGQSLFAVSMQI